MSKHEKAKEKRSDGRAGESVVGPVPALAKLPDDLLSRAPEEGARLVALFLATRAAEAHAALAAGGGADEAGADEAGAGAARDPEALHDFRVALRRLRVALKAFAPELDGSVSKSVRRRLRAAAQATNPAPHDTPHAADPRPGLVGLARRARGQREALAAAIGGRWLDGAATALLGELEACAAAIDASHEAPPVEIERKYLLKGLPRALRGAAAAEVEQGYLPGQRLRERVRRVVRDGRERFVRTVKLGAGVSRIEVEEETTRELWDVLWPATRAKRVRKRRYAVPEGELTWEIDEFTDRTLVLAEVELPAPDTPVAFPPWLAAYVVREVTDEPGYVNSALAKADAEDAAGGAAEGRGA